MNALYSKGTCQPHFVIRPNIKREDPPQLPHYDHIDRVQYFFQEVTMTTFQVLRINY